MRNIYCNIDKHQIVEEAIKSNDYDVWICSSCNNKTIEVFRGINYRLYISCTKCNSLAGKFIKSVITEHSSYSSSGQKRLDYNCAACGNVFSTYVTIPRLERSSSGGGYSSGSSGGGSSYSSGSSSSSFGGGSSGGGGSTSSW